MTPAGTSNELDVQNECEENTHTHTHRKNGQKIPLQFTRGYPHYHLLAKRASLLDGRSRDSKPCHVQRVFTVSYRVRNQGHPPPQSTSNAANVVGTTGFEEKEHCSPESQLRAEERSKEARPVVDYNSQKSCVSCSTIGEGGNTTIPSPGRSPKQPLPGIGLHDP